MVNKKYWFLGLILILIGVCQVNAASETYSYTFFNVKTCADSSHCITTPNYQVDTGYHEVTSTTEFQGFLKEWNVIFSNTGNGWTSNKTYTFKVGLGVNSSNVSDDKVSLYYLLTGVGKPSFYMYGNSTTSASEGVSSSYIQSYSCSITQNENAVNRIYLTCTFIPKQTIKMFKATIFYSKLNDLVQFDKYGYMTMDSFTSSEDTSALINNQTQVIQNNFTQTNQNINALNDNLTDTDVSEDGNDMADFINDFELEGDSNISTLVTLPITFIENVLVQNTTADLCVTFRGQRICLPNGKILWERNHQCDMTTTLCDNSYSINDFKALFTLLVGGFLSYKMIRSIVLTMNKALDPADDYVEVANL